MVVALVRHTTVCPKAIPIPSYHAPTSGGGVPVAQRLKVKSRVDTQLAVITGRRSVFTLSTRGSRALLAAAVLAVLLAGTSMGVAALTPDPTSPPQYTVASSRDLDTVAAGTVVMSPASRLEGASEKWTLVAVGGLLLGLAAAVRRTT
jgi:hypothetical protein